LYFAGYCMKAKLSNSDLRFLLSLVVVHAVFFVMALYYKRIYNGDSAEYIYMALNIKEHFWFYCGNPVLPVNPEYLTLRPLGYSLLMATVYMFALNNWIILVLQNVLSIFNIWYLRQSLGLMGYRKRYDWLLMAFIILYPPQFINANTIAPDILLQTCVLIYFRQFIQLWQKKDWGHAFWMSAALIAGVLVKPVLYPFTYIHCFLILWIALRHKALLKPFFAAVMPILVVLCYGFWNYQRTGKLHYTSTQSFNAIFYHYRYYAHVAGLDSATRFLENERKAMASIPVFKDRYDYANERGVQLMKDNFWPYLIFHTKFSLWIPLAPGKGDLDMFLGKLTLGKLYSIKQPPSLLHHIRKDGIKGLQKYVYANPTFPIAGVVLFFNCIRLLGLVLFLFYRKLNIYIRLFVVMFIGYFIFTAGPIANTRYFVPVSLIAMGAAVIGYQQVLQRFGNKNPLTIIKT
jgi:hypothetical protein